METIAKEMILRALHVAANSFGHVIGEHEELVEELRDLGFIEEAAKVDAVIDTIGGDNHKEIRANYRKALGRLIEA